MASSTSRLHSGPTACQDNFANISLTTDPGSCSGKTVFITGAAASIGQASAILFATAGADRIALTDFIDATITRTSALKAAVDAGKPVPEIVILSIDVRNVQSIEAGLREMTAHWGHIDILINN